MNDELEDSIRKAIRGRGYEVTATVEDLIEELVETVLEEDERLIEEDDEDDLADEADEISR